jgi:hypothetical protein
MTPDNQQQLLHILRSLDGHLAMLAWGTSFVFTALCFCASYLGHCGDRLRRLEEKQ